MTAHGGFESFGSPRVLEFETVKDSISSINPGDTVVGFASIEQVDALVPPLAHLALYPSDIGYRNGYYDKARALDLDASGRQQVELWPGQILPSDALRPRKVKGRQLFNGEFVNTSVTLLSDLGSSPDHSQPLQVELLLDAELHSTGRGAIGRSLKLLLVEEKPSSSGQRPPSRRVSCRSVEGDAADLAAQFLTMESVSAARMVAVNGLRNMMSAGLPGLGKRR